VVSRQITAGGLWWVCSRLLCAPDPFSEVQAIIEAVEDDTTARSLTLALDPEATVVVLGWPPVVADALVRRGSGETLVVDASNEGSGLVRYLDGHRVDAVDVPLSGLGAAVTAADVLVVEPVAASPSRVFPFPAPWPPQPSRSGPTFRCGVPSVGGERCRRGCGMR